MATFTVKFDTSNAAFDEPNRNAEIVRILRDIADRIEGGDSFDMFRNIHDIQGNGVGVFALKQDRG